MLGPQLIAYDQLGELQPRHGNRSANNAPRNTYECADGRWVAVSTSAQSIAERVMRLVGRPELIDEPWFATGGERAQHADELDDAVGALDRRARPRRGRRRVREGRGRRRPDLHRRRRPRRPAVRRARQRRHRRRRRARTDPVPERAVPALRDPGPRPDRRPAPRRAHRGGARPPRDRRRPARRAAGGGGAVTRPGARPELALRPRAPPGAAGQGPLRARRRRGARPRGRRARRGEGVRARRRGARRDRAAHQAPVGAGQRRRHPLVRRRPRRPGRYRPRRRARAQGRRPRDGRGARAAPGPAAAPAARDRPRRRAGLRAGHGAPVGARRLAGRGRPRRGPRCPAPGRAGVGAPARRRRVPGRRDRRADHQRLDRPRRPRTGSSTTAARPATRASSAAR